MELAKLPSNENERLAAVRALGILDSAAEERFDRITRLTRSVFDVPIAYVAVIDADRQWFKSREGLDASQTPRTISFCGHTVLKEDTLIIPDTHSDPRFADNPMVLGEPFIRFYAGEPIRTKEGLIIGTLCVADRKPHVFNDAQKETFKGLARMVESEIALMEVIRLQHELLNVKEKLIESRERLQREITDATRYVRSLLPAPFEKDRLKAEWQYVPSSELGGDAFGYHWLNEDTVAVYLLDVSGHGIGAALLATTIMNVLRSQALSGVCFSCPAAVLSRINAAFQMDEHDGRTFSLWHGVFDLKKKELKYASGGHPPAALLSAGREQVRLLDKGGIMLGIIPNAEFKEETVPIESGSTFYLYSDGAYEISCPEGKRWSLAEFIAYLSQSAPAPSEILEQLREFSKSTSFKDDVSLIRFSVR